MSRVSRLRDAAIRLVVSTGPRRELNRYVAGACLRAIILIATALTALLTLLEFVEQLASVGEGHYHVTDALIYVVLTTPARLLQVIPVSMLLGSLLALGGLSRNSELIAILGLGVSERKIVGSVLWLVLPSVPLLFLLMQFVIPPAQQMAQAQRASAMASAASGRDNGSVWAEHDRQYLYIRRFERGNVPVGIDVYTFRPDGSMETLLHAERATISHGGNWQLLDVTRKSVGADRITTDHLPSLSWHSFISPQQIRFLALPLDSAAPIALYQHIASLNPDQNATRFEEQLWSQATMPLAMVAMIMLATPFVFGSPRTQSNGRLLARGVGIGIVFSLSQQIVTRLGVLLHIYPAVTAAAPSVLVIVTAMYLFERTQR